MDPQYLVANSPQLQQSETSNSQLQQQARFPATATQTGLWPPVRHATTVSYSGTTYTVDDDSVRGAISYRRAPMGSEYTLSSSGTSTRDGGSNIHSGTSSTISNIRQYHNHHGNDPDAYSSQQFSTTSAPSTVSAGTNTVQTTSTPATSGGSGASVTAVVQYQHQNPPQTNVTSAVSLYHLLTSQISGATGGMYSTVGQATAGGNGGMRLGAQTAVATSSSPAAAAAASSDRESSTTTGGERWMRMAASSRRASDLAAVRRQFRGKVVCNLSCGDCDVLVCKRGMKAILLADTTVELFSTDSPPIGVQMVNDDYETRNCHCRIRDVACLNCGNLVGYHVTQPCADCLGSCNNGHFWMFHMDQVHSEDRMDTTGNKVLLWAQLPRECDETKNDLRIYESMCR